MAEFSARRPFDRESADHGRAPRPARPHRSSDQVLHLPTILNRLRRLSRAELTPLQEVRDDPSQGLSAILVMMLAVGLSAVGGWLWLIADLEGLSTGRILLRELLLGSVFAVGLWLAWVVTAQIVLRSLYGRAVERGCLVRCMGYAAAPLALSVLMVIPALSFTVGLLTLVAWVALSHAAVATAVPDAAPRETVTATACGFAVYAVVMSVLADAAGMAPGIFVHAADLTAYL